MQVDYALDGLFAADLYLNTAAPALCRPEAEDGSSGQGWHRGWPATADAVAAAPWDLFVLLGPLAAGGSGSSGATRAAWALGRGVARLPKVLRVGRLPALTREVSRWVGHAFLDLVSLGPEASAVIQSCFITPCSKDSC